MRNKLALLALASGVFIMSACNYNYVKTDTGLLYKIFNKGSKKLEPNHWLKVHYSEALGDSVLYSTFEHMPVYGR
ncbi:MAG TPA: hypothetical protein PKD90_07025, partial [Phnomibacter sp.]|nr:hypothetical protein [Phnomibacter sp.]